MSVEVFETATNRYSFVSSIGNGGSGNVYRVQDSGGGAFALKVLRSSDKDKKKRFKNELWFCQQNQHRNIIRVIDSGVTSDHLPFFVMPVYEKTLRARIKETIPHTEIMSMFRQLLDGVEAAHLKEVYHRDLKPENILISNAELVVADFGIAHFQEEELYTAAETRDQQRLANFVYAAPEQKVRNTAVDNRCDIFSLGLILNEMFTGHVPAGSDYPLISSVAPEFTYLDDIVRGMTKYSTLERPPTIESLKQVLIMRGNEFVEFQRLESVRNAVVPATQPDDPLNGQDVKLTGEIDYEYGPNHLLVGLYPEPPRLWWTTLGQLHVNSYIGSAAPNNVGWSNGKALLLVPPMQADAVLMMFRDWVAQTNISYRSRLQEDARRQDAQRREALRRQQQTEEERAKVLSRLRSIL